MRAPPYTERTSHTPTAVVTSECPTTISARNSDSTTHPQRKESQKLPFGCGCGKCTFFSFIERSCPTPIPLASSFPYLDLSGLTHEQQQELSGRLRFESQKIMLQFQELMSSTILSLKRRDVPLVELVHHIMILGLLNPVFKESQVPVFHHRFKELKAADAITKVFLVLKDYFSFFNYHIIEHIIEALGTEEDKTNIQRYKAKFNQYVKRRIFECPPEFGPVSDVSHAAIFVMVDSQYGNYTVVAIERFRHEVSEIIHLSPQGILLLYQVDRYGFHAPKNEDSAVNPQLGVDTSGEYVNVAYFCQSCMFTCPFLEVITKETATVIHRSYPIEL